MAEAADDRDGLEPTGVASGRVWLVVAAVFLLLFATFGLILAFKLLALRGDLQARARPFPFPALETSVAPRMIPDRGHGPKPYRELPAPERPARLGEPDPRLLAAERDIAARGLAAYDPLPPGAGR